MKIKQIFSIPNILSFIRIGLIPFIVWAFFVEEVWLSAGLILFSALTDIVDGYIARQYNMVTPLGKALDPIADKLTLLSIIVTLCFISDVVFIVLILFIVKETLLGIEGLIIVKKTGTTYSSMWHGKLTTVFLYLTMVIHVVWIDIPELLSFIFLCVCDVLMIMTLVLYTVRNVKALKEFNKNKFAD